ncbi:hypothetical protein [Criblamydia sequanensis]|uniref:Membrane protein n=1 Tax=Candidatus Criblamydia sequanensis CRIB-18 TaxID=1437425 RepID=A0A090D118_9BACT|nr:hypothetical protein [Criblamydia sequanensis]CDR35247.1 putative membrane protein [Criblamydia sequanensis CRIB-18]
MEAYLLDQSRMDFLEYETLQLAAMRYEIEKEQNEIPLKFVVGVSLMLGGAFIMFATPVCPMFGTQERL